MATVTRTDLAEAVHREIGFPRRKAAEFVETVSEGIAERLAAGETVGIASFGSFSVRDRGPRMGRKPTTGGGGNLGTQRHGVPVVGDFEEADQREDAWRAVMRPGRREENHGLGVKAVMALDLADEPVRHLNGR